MNAQKLSLESKKILDDWGEAVFDLAFVQSATNTGAYHRLLLCLIFSENEVVPSKTPSNLIIPNQ